MRILLIIIAILALLGGLANVVGGMAGFGAGILMVTTTFPAQIHSPEMPPQTIGFILLLTAVLMVINGLIFVVFAIGAFMRKRWARILGIFGYGLNIVVCLLTMLFSTVQGSMVPWIVGIFVAILFMIILAVSKETFEKPLNS